MEEIEVLTPPEVAGLLRVSVRSVQIMAGNGDLPGFRVGKHWRFRRDRVEAFMDAGSRPKEPVPETPAENAGPAVDLYESLLAYGKRGRKP